MYIHYVCATIVLDTILPRAANWSKNNVQPSKLAVFTIMDTHPYSSINLKQKKCWAFKSLYIPLNVHECRLKAIL